VKGVDFGALYIKPAFLFQDDDGSIKLQFEADAKSSLGYLYNALCSQLGLSWNYESPSNDYGTYTNCAMHAAGDTASYGCGPDNANSGGFCPQMTIAYAVSFQSEDAAAAFFTRGNNYVDYWRSKYPSGVAVGTDHFCPEGGCLGLFLNRYDLYQVFKPDLSGSWVEYKGGTFAPTISPAPSAEGGCDNPHNRHLDKCFRQAHKKRASIVAWESLGRVGQLSLFLVSFMAITLSLSMFLARARKMRKRGESYMGFLVRDITTGKRRRKKTLRKKKKKKKKRKRKLKNTELEEDILSNERGGDVSSSARSSRPSSTHSRSKSRSRKSKSKSRSKDSRRSSSRSTRSNSSKKRSSRDKERHRSSSKKRSSSRSSTRRSRSSSRTRSSSRNRSRSRSRKEKNPEFEESMSKRQLV